MESSRHILLLCSRNKTVKQYKLHCRQEYPTRSWNIPHPGFVRILSDRFRLAGGRGSMWRNNAWFPLKVYVLLPTVLKLEHKTKIICLCLKTWSDFICSLPTGDGLFRREHGSPGRMAVFMLLLFNVLEQWQMVLAFVFKLWKSWEGNVRFERSMSSFWLPVEVNSPVQHLTGE